MNTNFIFRRKHQQQHHLQQQEQVGGAGEEREEQGQGPWMWFPQSDRKLREILGKEKQNAKQLSIR
jgi:hypothetical protein